MDKTHTQVQRTRHTQHRYAHTEHIGIYIYSHTHTPTGVDEQGEVYTYTNIYISVFSIIDLFQDFSQALNFNDIQFLYIKLKDIYAFHTHISSYVS